MTEPFYTAEAEIRRVAGVHRRVTLSTGVAFDVGVHGAIREHYGLHGEPDRPLPVDFVVGAAGA
ncbi:MAG TPA: hypothetical protein VMM12_13175 [Longimicrobiales bacterium]|nr:hypothetical protein [Longimicrobiales bacterium]